MSAAISVQGLSKAYRIGVADQAHDTLAATAVSWLKAPFRNFRRLTTLTATHAGTDAADVHWALRDVSFEVQEGDIVGIIGRNGAGKSTLLKILSRITEPTGGKAVIRGRVSSLLEVGTGFHPELSGRENMYMNGTILGMRKKEIDRKFDQIVEFSGVQKFIDTPVKRYSSGMKVRLAFAVAAHLEPEILIIDEVLAVGDQEFQDRCIGKMGEVSRSGRTVLFVSHNMAAVQALCTHGICLSSGEVAMTGSADATLEFYQRMMHQECQTEVSLLTARRANSLAIPLMKTVRMLDTDGQPTSRFAIGSKFRLVVDFETTERAFRPVLGIRVKTSIGIAVFGIDNRMIKEFHFDQAVQSGAIEICIDRLPLMPGLYQVDLWLGDMLRSLDAVESAVSFEVTEADVTGTGKLPPPSCGPVFLPAKWYLESPVTELSASCRN